jgi:hypothetical protein
MTGRGRSSCGVFDAISVRDSDNSCELAVGRNSAKFKWRSTTSSTCRMSPPTLCTSVDLLARLGLIMPFFSIFLESKLGRLLAGNLVLLNPSFNPTNLIPKSSHVRLAPMLSRTVTLPDTDSPYGLISSKKPPLNPRDFNNSSVSGLARTPTCGAKARCIKFRISGDPIGPDTGDPERPSPPEKTVVPVNPLSVVGVEAPLLYDPVTDDVEAYKEEIEGFARKGREARDPLGDWVRCVGRSKDPSASV